MRKAQSAKHSFHPLRFTLNSYLTTSWYP